MEIRDRPSFENLGVPKLPHYPNYADENSTVPQKIDTQRMLNSHRGTRNKLGNVSQTLWKRSRRRVRETLRSFAEMRVARTGSVSVALRNDTKVNGRTIVK